VGTAALMEQGELKTVKAMMDFMLAGSATLTIQTLSGLHRTYKVKLAKNRSDGPANAPLRWFVNLLTGPDNTGDYTYVGLLEQDHRPGTVLRFRLTKASAFTRESPPAVWFSRFIDALTTEDPMRLKRGRVFHEGRCGKCNRKLTDPESIKLGLGPICRKNN
jgi:hypothetical protein